VEQCSTYYPEPLAVVKSESARRPGLWESGIRSRWSWKRDLGRPVGENVQPWNRAA